MTANEIIQGDDLLSQDANADQGSGSTLLDCLVICARHRGIHLSMPSLIREHLLGAGEPPIDKFLAIARASGLKAAETHLDFDDLAKLKTALPAIVLLKSGKAMVLMHVGSKAPVPQITLLDPRAGSNGTMLIDEPRYTAASTGTVILLKRNYREAKDERPFGWGLIFAEMLHDRPLIRDLGIAAFVLSLLAIAPVMFWRLLIDRVIYYQSLNTLYVLCLTMAVLVVFETWFGYLRRYMVLFVGRRVEVNLAGTIFARLLKLPIDFFERRPTGEITHDVSDMWKIHDFIVGNLLGTLLDSIVIVVILPILFFFSVVLTLAVLGFALLIGAWLLLMMPRVRRKAALLNRAEARKGAFLVETLFGIRTVKSLALDSRRRHEWDVHVAETAELRVDTGRVSNTIQTVILPLERMMTSGVFAFAVYLAITTGEQVYIGALMAFMMLTMRLAAPLSNLALLIPEYDEARIAVEVIGEIVNQPPEEGRLRIGVRTPIVGRIEFNNVRFRYHGTTSPALDGVSFSVPQGSIFGIVGRSGSGKTTVTRMLQALHSNYEGLIKVDDNDLRAIDLDHLRCSIGTVLQENFLFRGTVRETIAAAKPDATIEDVIRAARLAGAEEFIERLPSGYDTWIQEGSTNLSGGQRQRLAIARALITDPRILILDEATSALDAESEAIINANLLRIAKDRTLIIISHRLSSLIAADSIMVLERGRVYDVGPHDELLANCDIYRSLWYQQHRHLRQKSQDHEVIQPRIRSA